MKTARVQFRFAQAQSSADGEMLGYFDTGFLIC